MADERGEETAMAAGPSAEVTPAQVALITQTVEMMIRALVNRGEPSSGGPSGDASGRACGLQKPKPTFMKDLWTETLCVYMLFHLCCA